MKRNAMHATEWPRLIVLLLLTGILSVSWIAATASAGESARQIAEIQRERIGRLQQIQRLPIKSGPEVPLADFVRDDDPVDDNVGNKPPDPPPVVQQDFSYSDDAFNLVVFAMARTADESHSRLEVILRNKIEAIDRVCQLDETQKAKLRLAGHGSIQRCFDRVEELRTRYRSATDYRTVHELNVDACPLRFLLTFGPFGDRSLFGKTLRKTLSAEQAAKYELLK
jgi:hypothetical protein